MFKKIKLTCNDASTICDKTQYGEASFFEKIQLNWHLLTCKICCKYTENNKTMTKIFKMKAGDCKKKIKCLPSVDKDILKKRLEEFDY